MGLLKISPFITLIVFLIGSDFSSSRFSLLPIPLIFLFIRPLFVPSPRIPVIFISQYPNPSFLTEGVSILVSKRLKDKKDWTSYW